MPERIQTTLLCELQPLKNLPFKTPFFVFNIQTITRFLTSCKLFLIFVEVEFLKCYDS